MRNLGIVIVTGRFGVVEVAVGVGLEGHREFVIVLAGQGVVVEVLIVVDLAVAVKIVQPRDLIAARYVDGLIDNLDAERFVQAGSDALPGNLVHLAAESVHEPDVAHPRTHGGPSPVLEKVEPTQAHPRVIRVVQWRGDRVDGEGPVGSAERFDLGGEGFLPASRAAARQGRQVAWRVGGAYALRERREIVRLGDLRDEELKASRFGPGGDP